MWGGPTFALVKFIHTLLALVPMRPVPTAEGNSLGAVSTKPATNHQQPNGAEFESFEGRALEEVFSQSLLPGFLSKPWLQHRLVP